MFLIEEITVANLKDEPERLVPVQKILADLLETWKQASIQASKPVPPPPLSPEPAAAMRPVGQRLSMKG
jgi:flagellar protein FliS